MQCTNIKFKCVPISLAVIMHIKEGDKGVVFKCQHLHCKSQEIETLGSIIYQTGGKQTMII